MLRREHDIAVIARGFRADLVVLTRSPLDDIRNTRAIGSVDQDGREAPPVSQTVDH